MGVLAGLEPASVFNYFEEICNIPHGSGNEEQISNYIKEFADKRGLSCIQDEWNNIIIVKEATEGYEEQETIILQGHMDMVAVKEAESSIDMTKDALRLEVNGDYISAKETSLGGDDGIAVAYAMALLDSDDIAHPRLEVVLTVGEEVGMDGARVMDLSMLKGRRMLNLDNEEEGVLLTSCAGGAGADCRLPVNLEKRRGTLLDIQVKGLQGGHSGAEIHKEGGNANCLMGRVLDALIQKTSASLVSLEGGLADNAIPILSRALIVAAEGEADTCISIVGKIEKDIQNELAIKDKNVAISINMKENAEADCLQPESMKKAVEYILAMPNGIQATSADVKGLVETSLNLGIMKLDKDTLILQYAIRSSIDSAKEALIRKVKCISALAGAEVEIKGDYPGWAYRKDSPLRDKMIRIYEEMYGKKPEVQAIHAGLECGLFSGKIPGLDCISYGPDMRNIHTTEEVLSISSVKRVWEYVLEVLRQK